MIQEACEIMRGIRSAHPHCDCVNCLGWVDKFLSLHTPLDDAKKETS